jgi:two-component system cell cycle response regulator
MKILVADDDRDCRETLAEILRDWGHEVVLAENGSAAWEHLQAEGAPQLVVLDWGMPGMDGLELCRAIRRHATDAYTYVLMMTGRQRRQDIVEGLKAGADDYLIKPLDLSELEARLNSGLRILDLQAQLIAAREAQRHLAMHDPLTGLWNRAAILDILDRDLARFRREGRPVAVLMADIDHFKLINDTYGHLAGDAVLRETVARLQAVIRPYDSVGRYGGEEFLFVLSGCDHMPAVSLGERLRRAVEETPVIWARS